MRRLRHGQGILLLSVPLILEYEAVCTLPEQSAAASLDRDEALQVLDVLVAIAEPVEIKFLWRPQLRDPADEMVLETAVNGRADAIATFNIRDFAVAQSRFAVEVVSPQTTIAMIGQ